MALVADSRKESELRHYQARPHSAAPRFRTSYGYQKARRPWTKSCRDGMIGPASRGKKEHNANADDKQCGDGVACISYSPSSEANGTPPIRSCAKLPPQRRPGGYVFRSKPQLFLYNTLTCERKVADSRVAEFSPISAGSRGIRLQAARIPPSPDRFDFRIWRGSNGKT